jgi:hypothetical protein
MFLFAVLAHPQAELDWPSTFFARGDNMAGNWKLSGKIRQRNADHNGKAQWVLNHQFVRIDQKHNAPHQESTPNEAAVMLGYNNSSERCVARSVWQTILLERWDMELGLGI